MLLLLRLRRILSLALCVVWIWIQRSSLCNCGDWVWGARTHKQYIDSSNSAFTTPTHSLTLLLHGIHSNVDYVCTTVGVSENMRCSPNSNSSEYERENVYRTMFSYNMSVCVWCVPIVNTTSSYYTWCCTNMIWSNASISQCEQMYYYTFCLIKVRKTVWQISHKQTNGTHTIPQTNGMMTLYEEIGAEDAERRLKVECTILFFLESGHGINPTDGNTQMNLRSKQLITIIIMYKYYMYYKTNKRAISNKKWMRLIIFLFFFVDGCFLLLALEVHR